jgi:hypothetical protein
MGFLLGGTAAFMAVPTHEMRYYLPLVTAHALVVAILLDEALGRPWPKLAVAPSRVLLAFLAVCAVLMAVYLQPAGWPLLVAIFVLLGSFAAVRIPSRGWTVAVCLIATSLLVAVAHSYVLMPRRAASRDLEATAAQLRHRLPRDATVWVLSPADAASKHSSLYHYLGNRVRTFSADRLPPIGAFVIRPDPRPRSLVERSPAAIALGSRSSQIAVVAHAGGVFRLLRMKERPSSAVGGER